MPYGDNDWLALTQEDPLKPDLPICDPHHHTWDFRLERIPFRRYLLHELADFDKAVPDLTIILNHIGGPLRIGPYANRHGEVLADWRKGIAEAPCPNVVVKPAGIGMPNNGLDRHAREVPIGSEELARDLALYKNHCIEQFGPDQSMFESNFPPDKVSFSYNLMYNAFKRLSKDYSASERSAISHNTAVRAYGMNE